MLRRDRTHERLIALFLLGVLLLNPPFLLVFDRPIRVLGIPVLYLYLFLAWTVLIAAVAAVARHIHTLDVELHENPDTSTEKGLRAGERARDA
jgi:hypothetical protein